MTVEELSWFIALAEAEHVTEASTRLNVSQPTLSRALTRWEHLMDAPLFDRVNRRLRLNRSGVILLEHARRCVAELASAQERISTINHPDHGLVRLAFLHSAATGLMPDLLRHYRTHSPQVNFELRQAPAHELLDALRHHHTDVAVTGPRPNPEEFAWHTMRREQLCLAVPRSHRLAKLNQVELRQASKSPFIALQPEFELRQLTDELCHSAGFTPTVTFESTEIASMEGLVAAGLGVAVVPTPRPHRAEPEAVYLPLRDSAAHRVIGLVWPRAHQLPPVVQQFTEFVISGQWA